MNLALALSKVPRVIEVTGGYSTDARKNEYSPELRREIVCVVILCRVITTHPVEWQEIMAWLIRERDIAPKSKRLCSIFSEWVKRGLV